jgi:polyhydroxyalkanoate synthesis regulator phasin
MNKNTVRTSFAAAMGGAVLLAGLLVGASIALADDADTTVPETTTEGDAVERCHDFFRDRAQMFGGNLEELADELGSTLDELRNQLTEGSTLGDIAADAGIDLDEILAELREEALAAVDEKVSSGDLTQEEGDRIKERIESFEPGEFSFGDGFRGHLPEGFHFGRGFGDFRGFFGDLDLDIDLSELREALESGLSLDEALENAGIDLDSAIADAQASALAHLDELVADGTITQDRADQLKEMIESFEPGDGLPFGERGFRFDFGGFDFEGFDFDFEGFPFDRFDGHRGHGFFGGGPDDGANAEGALLDV